ncbi:hypothetical protein CK203_081709 [Vitis vinifera]|uniref:Uncharacterized protein n=1 Tax=Vitis vinifera TaxID=29760 RepID=A0A438EFC7_VITVI|nr:hypothetical protein CK203_081709 [Vitis vinifera]
MEVVCSWCTGSYRSKSGWVWLIPLSSPNDAAVEESSSKMRLFQKFSSSSKTRLFQKFSRCGSSLEGASDAENAPRGGSIVVRLVLDAWCGYGEFLSTCSRVGTFWERNEISVHGAAPSMHGAVASIFFLNGFPHVPEWYRCTLSSSEEMTLLFLKGRLHLFLSFNGAATPCTPLPTERTNSFQTTSLYFFLGAVVDLLFSSPVTVMEDTLESCHFLQRILSSSMVPLTLSIWKKSLTSLEKTRNLPHQSNMIRTPILNLAFIPSLYTPNIFFSPAKISFGHLEYRDQRMLILFLCRVKGPSTSPTNLADYQDIFSLPSTSI